MMETQDEAGKVLKTGMKQPRGKSDREKNTKQEQKVNYEH